MRILGPKVNVSLRLEARSQSSCTTTKSIVLGKVRVSYAIQALHADAKCPSDLICEGNNSYIFPGVGLGVIAARSIRVPNVMFLLAAKVFYFR
jgi:malic enzyme